jgi:hypothetical protein
VSGESESGRGKEGGKSCRVRSPKGKDKIIRSLWSAGSGCRSVVRAVQACTDVGTSGCRRYP